MDGPGTPRFVLLGVPWPLRIVLFLVGAAVFLVLLVIAIPLVLIGALALSGIIAWRRLTAAVGVSHGRKNVTVIRRSADEPL